MTPEAQRITNVFYLAFVLWREARAEIRDGKIALVYSIMNRVEHPKWWGQDVVSVCIAPWQYSSMTDPKDPQLTKYPGSDAAWAECIQIASDVYDKKLPNPVPGADSYYAVSMKVPPDWADPVNFKKKTGRDLIFVKQIGNHKFYNTDGDHPDNVKLGIDLT